MILCLDCGNTRLKWGLHDNGHWLCTGAVTNEEIPGLRAVLPTASAIDRVIGSNVAGESTQQSITQALAATPEWITARERQCGVTNLYTNPAQLGPDRWAALVGARALHDGACLVICAGTATTIDVLDADGAFQGGLILPGLDMMRHSLADNTARLEPVPGEFKSLPRNSRDAISSGTIHATLGAAERMFQHIATQRGAICLFSGGAARQLEEKSALPFRRIELLVLEGIAHIAEGAESGS